MLDYGFATDIRDGKIMQNRMQESRLDLEAPLISVRRHSVPPAVKPGTVLEDPAAAKPLTNSLKSTVPFYKSELKSGPFRNPGVIPFVWEKKPGQPRVGTASRYRPPPIPLLPPGRTPTNDTDSNGPSLNQNPVFLGFAESIRENKASETPAAVAAEEFLKEEEDNFSDAVNTLSCTESFFMNCSFSGLSGIPDVVEPSESFSADPQVKALMMDRFLPAAQAMATSSPQCPPRKPPKQTNCVENREHQLRRAPLPYQHRPNFVAQYPHDKIHSFDDDDEYDDDCEGNGHFTFKACGLLPRLCLKNSFCLLNPVSGMKIGGRHPLPPSTSQKISNILHSNVPLSQAKDEPWELVNKHKGGFGIPHQGEGGSKSTRKSNQHVQWINSQTLGGSSSCRGSRETLVETIKMDMGNGKSYRSESLIKDGKRYSVMRSSHGSQQGSGVFSPKMVKDVFVDSGVLLEISHSKQSSTDNEMGVKALNETSNYASEVSEVRLDNQRMEDNLLLEGYNGLVPQPNISGVLETDMVLCSRSSPVVVGQQNTIEHVRSNDGSLFLKEGGQSKNNSSFLHSLLPPPLPKTPSESWLSRTLPSVSAKIPSRQSIFDIHVPPRKQTFHSSSTIPRKESHVEPLESHHPQVSTSHCEPQQYQITLNESEEGIVKNYEPLHDIILGIKPSKPPRRQIRFADVLMTPLSPRSEM